MADGQVVFEITADGKHAIADIKEITKAIEKESKKWDDAAEESTKNIENSFGSMLKNLAAGFSMAKIGKSLLDFGKEAVQAASNLQEVQNVVDVTFGTQGAAKIEAWAKKAGTQFGLTETQAKQFTSTLGAMMKSSGLAGDEITEMSTDLAGLAADMASFYNLDFETAFQKIRSGISGETEPLKQLGINMSVANLNAYALKKGLSETFEQMSQGQQTMLRYQYLMEATADAQGDFARTSDGFANSIRALETNIESLKTNVGNNLLPAISWIVSSINSVFQQESGDGWSRRRTVLDDIADIDASTQTAIENITATRTHVEELTKNLEAIGEQKGKADTAAGSIKAAVSGVSNLASELSTVKIEDGAKEAFESTLAILYNNIDSLSEIKGENAEGVKAWLDGVAKEAKKLAPEDAEAWAVLMGSLVGDIPGFAESEDGQKFIEQLTTFYLALGNESETAAEGLHALGFGTDEIEEKQREWLETCKELVRTMPGLSSIIDTNTGEVKGGIPAIREYADEWERAAKLQAEISGLAQKKEVLTGVGTQAEKENSVTSARAQAKAYLKAYGHMTDEQADAVLAGARRLAQYAYNGENFYDYGQIGYDDLGNSAWRAFQQFYGGEIGGMASVGSVRQAEDAVNDLIEAEYDLIEFEDVLPKLTEEYNKALEEKSKELNKTTEELNQLIDAEETEVKESTTLQKAKEGDADALKKVTDALTNANEALKTMADYAEGVKAKVKNSIDGVVNSLGRVDYNAFGKTKDKITDLTLALSNAETGSDKWKELNSQIEDLNKNLVTTDSIYKALESQETFLDDYLKNMEAAQKMGLSGDLLSTLSDGTVESAQYLSAIVNDKTGKTAKQIDQLFQTVQQKKKQLTDTLTEQQLTADEVYQQIAENAKKAIEELALGQEAGQNTADTVQAIADAISDKQPEVQTAVDSIIAEIERLTGLNINVDIGGNSIPILNPNLIHGSSIPGFETGLNFVPYDGFLASLHEGEGILTAEENRIWQDFKNGQRGVDYDQFDNMISGIKPGGNVYLDGRIVGSVISEQQGRAYRQLQRSGWQA